MTHGSSVAPFAERQRTLLSVTDELLAERSLSEATWNAVEMTLGRRETIELRLLVGHYQGLASAIGGLGLEIEPLSCEQTRPDV